MGVPSPWTSYQRRTSSISHHIGTSAPEFDDDFGGGLLPAIALDGTQRIVVTLLAIGQAGIRRLGYEIAEIASIADGGFDTLIGDEARDHHLPDPKIAQDIVYVGRDEHA